MKETSNRLFTTLVACLACGFFAGYCQIAPQGIKSFGFPDRSGTTCGAPLLLAADGALSGTAYWGGSSGDGESPLGLILGRDGILYGTTHGGGSNLRGTILSLHPDGTRVLESENAL
jgi:uncharacterized repeat protein (TIGR03803 family)